MDDNSIGCEGLGAFGGVLKGNKSLRRLDVSNNGIGIRGAVKMVDGLRVNEGLGVLRLADNNIGTKGASAVAEALGILSYSAYWRKRPFAGGFRPN